MNRHIVRLEGLRERASATPSIQRGPAASRGVDVPVSLASSFGGTLDDRLQWFARAIMTPESQPCMVGEREAARLLTRGPSLSALERLEIYRHAYHARLVECLADDYPVLKHAMGHAAFDRLCRAYIAHHPSKSPSLNYFGAIMAVFCRDEAPEPFGLRGFAADLAALEWAVVEVIHAPSAPPLTIEALDRMPADGWAAARLEPNTAFRLLRFEYPVNEYFQAVRDRADPTVPNAALSATVVYRSGPTVWRMDLTPPMFEVLSALCTGETLGASLGRAENALAGAAPVEIAQRVTHWFREWVASGLFVRVVPSVPSL